MTITSMPRAEVRYNTASNNIITFGPFTVAGVAISSSATATITITDPSGTALATDQAMTADLPYFTYDIDTSTTASWPVDEGYKAVITVTYSSDDYLFVVPFDVVMQPFPCMVSDTDLATYFPDSANRKGGLSNYSAQIIAAFEEVKAAILSKGYRPALLFDPQSFRPAIIYRTLAMLAKGVWKKEEGDRWEEDYTDWMEQYRYWLDMALDGVSTRYDTDEDGKLSDSEIESYQPIRMLL